MLGTTPSRRRLFWTLQLGTWSALVPLFIGVNLLIGSTPAVAFFNGISRQVIGFFLTLALSLVYRRWSWTTFSLRRHGTVAFALSLGATLADVAACEALRHPLQLSLGPIPAFQFQLAGSIIRICVYASWSALYLSLRFFFELSERDLRLAQAELSARDAELKALRAQLNPHFLFNALNSILAEADDNPARVKAITLNLSDLLRFSLRQRDHFASLGAEIEAIENYLRVERTRFEERLEWELAATPAAFDAVVPTALLLPLVENAIKYGFQTSPKPLRLRIGADCHEHTLQAFVENSGRWIEPDPTVTRSTGIGLENLRRRLVLLCGPAARVEIAATTDRVRVELHVPLARPLA